jgi:hypothetical protein
MTVITYIYWAINKIDVSIIFFIKRIVHHMIILNIRVMKIRKGRKLMQKQLSIKVWS